MKILDRYIAKNFLYGYFIALCVLLGMVMTMDMFVNLDEFAEQLSKQDPTGADYTFADMLANIGRYYSVHSLQWFRDLAAMVIVIAAVFSLARMTRNNELIAVMASGVSLKRVLAPILILSLLLTVLVIVDQEILIPRHSQELMRSHEEFEKNQKYDVWFLSDGKGSLFCSREYSEGTRTLAGPVIILRESLKDRDDIYRVTGRIQAEAATYDAQQGGWVLKGGRQVMLPDVSVDEMTIQSPREIDFYPSDLKAEDIPVRRREGFMPLLSLQQLTELQHHAGARKTDLAELALQKHTRITDPIMNIIMLMVALPVLICRDPKAMKNAIIISFVTTFSCFMVVFICRLFATEPFFGRVHPAMWAWAPIFIFFPIAVIEIDSMRT